MKKMLLLVAGMALMMTTMSLMAVGAEGPMSYSDETGDVEMTGGSDENKDDVDIVSVSCEVKAEVIKLTLVVVGDIVGEYGVDGADGWNSYTIGLDLDGDEDYVEINVKIDGLFTGEDMFVHINTPSTIEALEEDNYDIDGSTFTAEFDLSYMGEYDEVLDFTCGAMQTIGIEMNFDYVNYDLGGDDKPYDGSSSADDDDTDDDDTTDDDSDDDDTGDDEEEDDPACGGAILIPLSILIILIFIAGFIKKNK